MNLACTFDPRDIAAVDGVLRLIDTMHPTAITDHQRTIERRAQEAQALAEMEAARLVDPPGMPVTTEAWATIHGLQVGVAECTCVGTRGYHDPANDMCRANVLTELGRRAEAPTVPGRCTCGHPADVEVTHCYDGTPCFITPDGDAELEAWHPASASVPPPPPFVCPQEAHHGAPFRYCPVENCGWAEGDIVLPGGQWSNGGVVAPGTITVAGETGPEQVSPLPLGTLTLDQVSPELVDTLRTLCDNYGDAGVRKVLTLLIG